MNFSSKSLVIPPTVSGGGILDSPCPSRCPSVCPSVCSFLCFCASVRLGICIYLHYIHCCCYSQIISVFPCQFINIILYCIKAAVFKARWRLPSCFLSSILYWPQYSAYDTIMHITGPLISDYTVQMYMYVYYTYKINCNMLMVAFESVATYYRLLCTKYIL